MPWYALQVCLYFSGCLNSSGASVIVNYMEKTPLSKTCAIKDFFFLSMVLKESISLDCIHNTS